jgi:hypothetical protein
MSAPEANELRNLVMHCGVELKRDDKRSVKDCAKHALWTIMQNRSRMTKYSSQWLDGHKQRSES